MVIDASALLAIIFGEAERRPFIEAIASAETRLIAAPTLLEASMVVISRGGEERCRDLRDFCARASIDITPFTSEHMELALGAFRQFGKGRHAAGLNFGDCLSYALAKATGEPLLFKGDDFSKTDIGAAL